jgi:hypothetical protein
LPPPGDDDGTAFAAFLALLTSWFSSRLEWVVVTARLHVGKYLLVPNGCKPKPGGIPAGRAVVGGHTKEIEIIEIIDFMNSINYMKST